MAYVGAPTEKRTVNFSVDGPTNSAADMDNWKVFEGQPNYNYIIKQPGWEHKWDANAEVPYAVKGKYFLSYDDVPAIEKKAQYIVDNNLGGVIVWQVHGDIKCEGTFINHGTNLKTCTKLSSPLAEAIDRVFTTGTVPNNAPVLTVPAAQSADAGQVISFVVSATDADAGDKLTFSATNATVVDNGDGSASVTYKAPNTATNLQEVVTVKVTDGRKSVVKDVVVNVKGSINGGNTAPVLTVPATATVASGQQVVIAVSADDADGDSLTYTVSSGTVTSTAAGANVTFTAPAVSVDTVVNLVVTVSDGLAEASSTIAVTVTAEGNTTWDPSAVYVGGDIVTYNGLKYKAKWWTKGEQPDQSNVWQQI